MRFCVFTILGFCGLVGPPTKVHAQWRDGTPYLDSKPEGLEQAILRIKRTFSVRVHWRYDPDTFFSAAWRSKPVSAGGSQTEPDEAEWMVYIIERFLSKYSKDFIHKNLRSIYLVKEMRFYGHRYAGTYSPDSIYIACTGLTDGSSRSYLEATLHCEFSSILLRNHGFPAAEWSEVNERGWKYSGYGKDYDILGRADLHERTAELLAKGFLKKYAQASPEEDFNSYVRLFIENPRLLYSLASRHGRIAQKLRVCREFYRRIDSGFSIDTGG
jgi:hypothetical protein